MPFTCSICGEEATQICARCTKDVCSNHLCEKCLKCSDCCECEVVLREPTPLVRSATIVHAEPPAEPLPSETNPETPETPEPS